MTERLRVLFLALLVWIPGVQADSVEWPVFGGDADFHRHTQASLITPANVADLQAAWEYDSGVPGSFQATPIVTGGRMYLSLPFNDVVALDAVSGEEIWRYRHDRDRDYPLCCGPANRGVAVAGGRVFMGTVDGRLVALDAASGKRLWDSNVVQGEHGIQEDPTLIGGLGGSKVDGRSGAGLNMAPMVFDNKVIIGITGVGYGLHLSEPDPDAPLGTVVGISGLYGRKGFLAAFDVATGKRQWTFETVRQEGWEGGFVTETPDGVPLPRDIEAEKARLAQFPQAAEHGGGSAWTTPVIDPESGLLFFGTGNPSPQMEASSRPGDNLYTVSIVALNARTGEYVWHYQQVPHDLWGYDVASPPVLFTVRREGREIPVVGQAGKTGWFYVLERDSGALVYKSEAFVPQGNIFALPSAEGVVITPGVLGGASWSPVSIDAGRRLAFVAGIHWPVRYTLHEKAREGRDPLRYASLELMQEVEKYGLLSAINLDDGTLRWQHRTPNPLVGGVMSTATGLVFSGEGAGELFALSAETGEKLWSGRTDAGVNAPPVSYQINGRQYVAVAAGGNQLFGFPTGQTLRVWALAAD